jgi:hypothetical protein
MRRGFALLVAAAAISLGVLAVPSASADDEICGSTAFAADGTARCLDEQLERDAGSPPTRLPQAACRLPLQYVSWTGTDWLRLAEALVADPAACGEYWVSIPPLAADKKGLRVLQDDVIRALGPNIHPVAEMTLGENTGWANWVAAGKGTWYEAGVEFRRRMGAAGYDPSRGETWLLNEFDRSTMRDAARTPPDQTVPAYRRADMLELLRGLYDGAPGMPPLPGIVEFGIHFRHQNIPNVPQYHAELKGFLEDSAFWAAVDPAVRFFAVETYPDVRFWGVPGSSRNERWRHLEEYIFHVLDLARNGPRSVDAARTFLERAYLPLMNAGWRARGGDQFDFVTGHGNTIVDAPTMEEFVSEQVLAARHYAGTHTQGGPAGRIGFSWQPCDRSSATEPNCRTPFTASFAADLTAITARIAEAVANAYREGGASPVGACGAPGSGDDWCNADVPDAAFTEAWHDFGDW